MPDRILRAELLESEAWLALKDNSDRACYIACLLTADNFGQMPAGPHRLVKLWRPYGIDTPEKSAKAFGDLVDVDLVRRYTADSKPYLYIPRFKQSRRFLGHIWPLSPWATDEEKQRITQKSPVNHLRSHVIHRESPLGVGVGVGVGVGEELKTLVAPEAQPGPLKSGEKELRRRATRLPSDWRIPDEWLEWAASVYGIERQRAVRISLVFRDFWVAKAGQNGAKMDWAATWRNWVRKEVGDCA